jgi:hypothetical protein
VAGDARVHHDRLAAAGRSSVVLGLDGSAHSINAMLSPPPWPSSGSGGGRDTPGSCARSSPW